MDYKIIDNKIYNDAGQIAIRYYQNTGKLVRVGSAEYLFRTLNNVCLAWVNPEHVNGVFAIRRNCCGNNKADMFFYASEMQVRLWLGLSARS